MQDAMTVEIAQRGLLTLPKRLRDRYRLEPGDRLTLLDLGGVFVLSARKLEVERAADRLRAALEEQGESLESMLLTLREERARYGQEAPATRKGRRR
jgi:bifunctional DNA-binding transcriptional regulator/antitoxin component of YhaV-PrlF toxin-antitoxin module